MYNEAIYTEKVGRFTINISQGEEFQDANEWGYTGAKLYAENRDFYAGLERNESLWDIITGVKENTKFYFVDWALYSSASNPVLRWISEGFTIKELAKECWKDHSEEDQKEFIEYCGLEEEEAILEKYLQDGPDLQDDCMIAVEPLTDAQLKEHDASYYGFTSQDINAKQTLEDWKSYLDGCYEWMILDEENEVIEAVGGYYGDSKDDEYNGALTDARLQAEALEKKAKHADKKMLVEAKKGSITMDTKLSDMLTSDDEQVKRLAKGIYKTIQ